MLTYFRLLVNPQARYRDSIVIALLRAPQSAHMKRHQGMDHNDSPLPTQKPKRTVKSRR
jgi:hypothetical protein